MTKLGSRAFDGCSSLSRINLPAGWTKIGPGAFCGCSGLTEIDLPAGLTEIGSGAFRNCSSLTGIDLPAGLTEIGSKAFYGCSALTEINLPAGLKKIDIETFYGCSSLASVIIPENVKSIYRGAFWDCSSLASVTIPQRVRGISSWAFRGCRKDLTIYGKTGSWAEKYAKRNNIKFISTGKIKKTTISSKDVRMEYSDSYTYDGTEKRPDVIVQLEGTSLEDSLIKDQDYTVSYENNVNAGTARVIVKGKGYYEGTVTKKFTITVRKGTSHFVGGYKYQVTAAGAVSASGIGDKKITKIKIPKTVTIGGKKFKVTAIGKNAFKKNTKITSVEIGDNVKIMGASSFEGCTKLAKVTLGKGVVEIGGNTFKGDKKLNTITIKSNKLKKVGKNALKGIKDTAKVKVPKKKLSSYKKLFRNKGQGRKVKITR